MIRRTDEVSVCCAVHCLSGSGVFYMNYTFHSYKHHVQTASGAHPDSYQMGTGRGVFPRGKVVGAWDWQLTSN